MKDCYRDMKAESEAQGHWVQEWKEKCTQTQDQGSHQCSQQQDQGYAQCSQSVSQGYNTCSQTADQGYNSCSNWGKNCCTWAPCSWACQAFTLICIGWTWISNVVCVTWTWVSNIVCVAWTWVTNLVCIAWVWISNIVCVAWGWVVEMVWVAYSIVTYWLCMLAEFLTNLSLTTQLYWLVLLQNISPKDTPRNPLEKRGWKLTFSDDFDIGQLDVSKWIAQSSNGNAWDNNPRDKKGKMTVYFSPTNFAFTSTTIKIIASNQPQQNVFDIGTNSTYNVPYTVGLLQWIKPLQQQQGYFEIRCKIPNSIEMWLAPALAIVFGMVSGCTRFRPFL